MRLFAATLTALVVLSLLAITPTFSPSEEHSALAPADEGPLASLERNPVAGRFEANGHPAEFRFTRDTAALDPRNDALVIIAPNYGYTLDEARDIRLFLEKGGRLIITVAGAPSQELLNRMSVGISTSGLRIYTPAFNETPDRVIAFNVADFPGLPSDVIVQRSVAINGGQPILRTADLTWEDRNDNGRPDLNEPLRTATLAAYANVGEGRIYVIGDATLFHTQAAVANAFFDAAAEGGRTLVFDEAHRPFSDPFAMNRFLTGRAGIPLAAALTVTLFVSVAIVTLAPRFQAARTTPRLSRNALTDERLIDALTELEP